MPKKKPKEDNDGFVEVEYPSRAVDNLLNNRETIWESRIKGQLDMIEGWARNGLKNGDIAKNLRITRHTMNNYLKQYPEFADTIERGRYHGDLIVENAMFKRATGYRYAEVTKERQKVMAADGSWTGAYEMVETKRVIKQVDGDVNAQKYWLEHRSPVRWERNPVAGLDPNAIGMSILSIAELLKSPVPERTPEEIE